MKMWKSFQISLKTIISCPTLIKSNNCNMKQHIKYCSAAAAKLLQSSPTRRLHRWQPTRLPHPWDSPGKNTGVGCHLLLQSMKVKYLSRIRLFTTTRTPAYQFPTPMGFSRQLLQLNSRKMGQRTK